VTPVSAFFDTISPIARSVTEVAAVFRAIAGHDPQDPFSARHTGPACGPADDGRLDGLRIGIPSGYFLDGLDPGVEQAAQAAIATLGKLGARPVVVDLPDPGATRGHFEALFHTDCAHEHRARYESDADRLGADTRERLEMLGRSVTGMTYAAALSAMRVWQWQIGMAFAEVDLIAHPTAPMVAPTVAEAAGTTGTTRRMAVFLYPWSFAQVPVLSLPMGPAEHGLPCGLSLVAPPWHEERLFRVGAAFQRVTDWHLRRPPLLGAPVSGPGG
jgi:aspartyl-tRNA(Asn)/glutamyl-tRNA(Gln) amidotransferase subunit A